MPKSGKNSASSATRKKHARKAAAVTGDEPVVAPPASKKIKPKKGEKPPPRVKQYIAPSKPAPAKVDPLDSLGLVHTLDQDLVVILRRLAKKDSVTREKAIEDLRIWMDHNEGPRVSEMIPVWVSGSRPSLLSLLTFGDSLIIFPRWSFILRNVFEYCHLHYMGSC